MSIPILPLTPWSILGSGPKMLSAVPSRPFEKLTKTSHPTNDRGTVSKQIKKLFCEKFLINLFSKRLQGPGAEPRSPVATGETPLAPPKRAKFPLCQGFDEIFTKSQKTEAVFLFTFTKMDDII